MLNLAVLGLLREGPHHGYQVRRRLQDLGFRRFSFGSLYPAFKRLEARGYIEAVRSTSGSRKSYRLTGGGADVFNELLQSKVADSDERQFRVRLAFFGHLGSAQRLRVLDERQVILLERLVELRRSRRRISLANPYSLTLVERSIETTENEISWIDGLLAGERARPGANLTIP